MKACIYGAGAIGGWIGSGLARAGCSVSVVARGATLEALQLHGLRLKQGKQVTSQAVASSAQPADLGVQDLVVLAVKAPSLPEVARQIAPLLGPATMLLTAMNGVPWWFLHGFGGALAGTRLTSIDPAGALAEAMPPRHVIGCVVHANCSVAEPGLVRHHFGNKLIVGEPTGERTGRLRELAGLLEKAGFEIERATYANWTFFAPILAGRTLMKLTGIKPESENNVNVSALNGVFGKLFGAERFWLKNFNFPFGVSIVIVAKKAEARA